MTASVPSAWLCVSWLSRMLKRCATAPVMLWSRLWGCSQKVLWRPLVSTFFAAASFLWVWSRCDLFHIMVTENRWPNCMEVRCCCRHRILLQWLGLDLEWCLDSDKTSRIYTEKNAWNETNDSFYTGISAIILEGWVYERLGKSHSPIWNLCCSDLGGQRNLLFGVRQLFNKSTTSCHVIFGEWSSKSANICDRVC